MGRGNPVDMVEHCAPSRTRLQPHARQERRAGVRAGASRPAALRVSAATPSRRAFRDDQFLNTYVACGLEFVPDLSPRTCVGRDVQRDARPDALDSVAGNVSPPPVTSAVGPAERLPEN